MPRQLFYGCSYFRLAFCKCNVLWFSLQSIFPSVCVNQVFRFLTLVDVQYFAESHKLCFNVSESTCSLFTTNRHLHNYQPNFVMNGQKLPYGKYSKCLDPEILSNKHIEHETGKSQKRLNILKYITGRDWGANASTLRTTYTSLIRSVFGLRLSNLILHFYH